MSCSLQVLKKEYRPNKITILQNVIFATPKEDLNKFSHADDAATNENIEASPDDSDKDPTYYPDDSSSDKTLELESSRSLEERQALRSVHKSYVDTSDSNCTLCPLCLGIYSRRLLWKHKKICPDPNKPFSLSEYQDILVPKLNVNNDLKLKVFSRMRADLVSIAAKKDMLICTFGASTKIVVKYDTKNEVFKSPSFAMNISRSIKDCCSIAVLHLVKQKHTYGNITSAEAEANITGSDLNIKTWNKITIIPLATDLGIFENYLIAKANDVQNKLETCLSDKTSFNILMETAFCRLLLLKRERVGELAITSYTLNHKQEYRERIQMEIEDYLVPAVPPPESISVGETSVTPTPSSVAEDLPDDEVCGRTGSYQDEVKNTASEVSPMEPCSSDRLERVIRSKHWQCGKHNGLDKETSKPSQKVTTASGFNEKLALLLPEPNEHHELLHDLDPLLKH
nr:unnamed protein product [Callosobruchus analis]